MDITVVIPTYNRGALIGAALDCVLAQTVLRLGLAVEVAIIDDGSTDDTARVVEPYLRDWPKPRADVHFTYTRLPKQGVVTARNTALARTGAPYVAFLDSDDFWTPQKLERQMGLLNADPAVGVVHTSFRYVDEAGELADHPDPTGRCGDNPCTGSCVDTLLREDLVIFSSTLFRRRVIEEAARRETHGLAFDPRWTNAQDYDLLLRSAALTRLGYINEPLTLYRLHNQHGAMGNLARAFGFHARVQMDFAARHGARVGVSPDTARRYAADFLYQRADSLFWQRKLEVARALCATAGELGLHDDRFTELEGRLARPSWIYRVKDAMDWVWGR